MIKNKLSLFVTTFLIVGFFVLALPEKGYSGINGIPQLGCCLIPPGDICTGCGSQDCSILDSECTALSSDNQLSGGKVCVDGTTCVDPFDDRGCCVISAGRCIENQTLTLGGGCDAEGGRAWFLRTDCSEVPECAFVADVPTLSGWGLISLAVVLGIMGIVGFMVMRRRKVSA